MTFKRLLGRWAALAAGIIGTSSLLADPPAPPTISSLTVTGAQKRVHFTPYPATQQYKLFRTDDLRLPFAEDTTGALTGFDWILPPMPSPMGFYRVQANLLTPDALTVATALNRLAYGPTPDELERVTALGANAYLAEQLAPESIVEDLDGLNSPATNGPNWIHVTATGTASSSVLYIYLSAAGEAYLDDLTLVAGSVPESGANLLKNGNFETPLSTNDWTVATNLYGSDITTTVHHGGASSLHILANAGPSFTGSAILETISPALTIGSPYSIGYWYLPATNGAGLTVRLSSSGISSSPDNSVSGIARRLETGGATLADLRAWFLMHGVSSRRQLLEILDQFLENHFVTQYTKSVSFFDAYYDNSTVMGQLAANLEYRENKKWRAALMGPNVTFYDLLRISAESPAMIIYLDTINSKGNGSNVANENYARELLELFTFGVDNGYDQTDVTIMSRAWTGWSVDYVDAANINNPFALHSTNVVPGATTNLTALTNLIGVWSFIYKQASHNTAAKTIFPGKTVPARFGAPWAGRSYQLVLPARTGTNGINDGYDVIQHLANQPFTEEFLSVKLCRIFVHDDFAIGYDFTDPNLSAEGQLVEQCMLAWENSTPKGQLRPVLQTIFNSDLFRSHGGSRQKVKTPLEFVVSSIRALRSDTGGPSTAEIDAYNVPTTLSRMGSMTLFDREMPDGFPEAGPSWISAGTLAERLRFAQAFLIATGQNGKTDAFSNTCDPAALVKRKLPQASWQDASAVADYFINLLYLGEGKANLDEYHTLAVNFLNTANGTTVSAFSALSLTGNPPPYETRLRGMIGMLMTLPRFQEQ